MREQKFEGRGSCANTVVDEKERDLETRAFNWISLCAPDPEYSDSSVYCVHSFPKYLTKLRTMEGSSAKGVSKKSVKEEWLYEEILVIDKQIMDLQEGSREQVIIFSQKIPPFQDTL